MYLQVNIVKSLLTESLDLVMTHDRMLYADFMTAIEKFCTDNNVLIGGKIGLDMLVGNPITKDSFIYDIYFQSANPFLLARSLADTLHQVRAPHINSKYVVLMTNIRNQEFTININTRSIVKINNIGRYRGVDLGDLMQPMLAKGYFTEHELKCVPNDMQLIEVYRILYSPNKTALWPDYIKYATNLLPKLLESLRDSNNDRSLVEGKGEDNMIDDNESDDGPSGDDEDPIEGGRGDDSTNHSRNVVINDAIIHNLIANSNNILIGDYAIDMLYKLSTSGNMRLQMISSDDVDELAARIEKIIAPIVHRTVTHVKYHLSILYDFRLTKHIIYLVDKTQIPLIDIFNSTSFELIPFITHKKIRVGNPFVLSRFKLLDIWTLKIISKLSGNIPQYKHIESNAKQLEIVGKVIGDTLDSAADVNILFPVCDYMGTYVAETVAKKKLVKNLKEHFGPYYPGKKIKD